MPRYKTTRTTYERRKESAQRYKASRYKEWIDPYPWIQGTVPEKQIYAKLVQMGVRFIYQGNFQVKLPDYNIFKEYRPDFILPDVKIIIDPFGSYWHSTAASIESDSFKFALFQLMGYKVVIWWDYEIEQYGLDNLIARVPELNRYNKPKVSYTEKNLPKNVNQVDDLKGLRKMNARKRKPYATFVGTSRRKSRKARSGYAV